MVSIYLFLSNLETYIYNYYFFVVVSSEKGEQYANNSVCKENRSPLVSLKREYDEKTYFKNT